jgi:diguanylate cyclase (GGDEF)-like protein/PAS domain S-box-containing protein
VTGHRERSNGDDAQRYRSLVEHLPMISYVAERTDRMRLRYVSPQVEALTGYPPEAWLGDSLLWLERLHPEDRDRVLAVQEGRPAAGGRLDYEYRILGRDGRVVWVRDRDVAVAGHGSTTIEGVLLDVTSAREAQARLGTAEARHASVFSALSEGIVVVAPDGEVLDVNAAALEILGIRREDTATERWWRSERFRSASGEALIVDDGPGARVLATGVPELDVELAFTRPDGVERWLTLNYEALRPPGHEAPAGLVLSFRDQTERRQAEEESRMFASLVELSGDFIAVASLDGAVLYVNAAGRRLVGLEPKEDVRGLRVADLLTEEGARASIEIEKPAVIEHGRWEGEGTLRHRLTGAQIDVRISSYLVRHPGSGAPWVLATVRRDITEEKRAHAALLRSQRRFEAQFRSSPVPTYAWQHVDGEFLLVDCNDAADTITEGGIRAMFGTRATDFFPDVPEVRSDIERCQASGQSLTREFSHVMRSTGELKELVVTYTHAPPDLVLVHTLDVTARVRQEQRLRELAERDDLTGLHNRRYFEQRLSQVLGADLFAVILVDVDHFKFVNDSLGHAAGDALLGAVADGLRSRVRSDDVVARFGGDEFAALLIGADIARARSVAADLLAAVRSRMAGVAVTASAGVAVFTHGDVISTSDALVAADIALYHAKQAGRDRVAVFGGVAGESLTWLERIRAAIAEDRLVLHAQPIIDLRTDAVGMEELLVRMVDEEGRLIPPASFLPTAEQFGLVREIDRWVIERGIARAAAGRHVTINLSARSLADLELPHDIAAWTEAHGTRPSDVTFEFTETAAVSSVEDAREFTRRLGQTGCSAALDDFGTGFGTFLLLKHLPVTYLKIDMEFVRELGTSQADQRIVRSVVNMAAEAGLQTIAEGVEDAASLELLRSFGVDYAQGFHIAPPSAVEALS